MTYLNGNRLQLIRAVKVIYEGADVEANPAGAATDDLEKLRVDETIYNVGGGTDVEANPADTATETLNKIKIDNIIYSLPATNIEQFYSKDLNELTQAGFYMIGDGGGTHAPQGESGKANVIVCAMGTSGIQGCQIYISGAYAKIYYRTIYYTSFSNWHRIANASELFSGSYNDLSDKPTIPTALSDLSDDANHRVVTDTEKSTWNGKSDFSGSYNDLSNKPTIPTALSDLSDDANHRVVTDTEKATWNGKSDFSGSYNDLSNKPTIPQQRYNHNVVMHSAYAGHYDFEIVLNIETALQPSMTVSELISTLRVSYPYSWENGGLYQASGYYRYLDSNNNEKYGVITSIITYHNTTNSLRIRYIDHENLFKNIDISASDIVSIVDTVYPQV